MNVELKKDLFNKCVILHIKKGRPVGSKLLKKKFFKHLADSTLRFYLNRLVKEKLLENVNEYAGRVPTDYGWRNFLEWNLEKVHLNQEEVKLVSKISFKNKVLYFSKEYKIYYLIKENDGHFVEGGLENVLRNNEFYNIDLLKDFADFLRLIKEHFNKFTEQLGNQDFLVYIGSENPLKLEIVNKFSLIIKRSGNRICSFVALKRLNYPYITKFINEIL